MASWQVRNCLAQSVRRMVTSSAHTQLRLPDTTSAALNILRTQPSQYIIASVVGRKYILTPRDLLTVPHLKDVKVGDVLDLKDIHEIGSREYTLRGDPTIPPHHVKVQATVVEHTKGKMEVVVKKKRRKGYQKTIRNKHPYTRLRIGPIQLTDIPAHS
ncbi:ribosomal protein L21-like protein [Phlebopus sp. FC_14]|nr:ribosomal protein L21-like protein [Phlebopus sp. FC_14]